MRRLIAVLICGLGLCTAAPVSTASGQTPGGGTVGGGQASNQEISAYVRTWINGGLARPVGTSSCGRWAKVDSADAVAHAWDTRMYSNGVSWRWYVRDCQATLQGTWVAQPPFPPIDRFLADLLNRQHLPDPVGGFAPPADRMIVKLGTWFWVDPAQANASYEVRVGFPNLMVSVTAQPTKLRYTPGDGNAATECAAPGRVWTAEYGDDTDSPCMYAYTHSSRITADDVFHASLAIDWETWLSYNGVRDHQLAPQTTTTDLAVTVKEVQAIVTA